MADASDNDSCVSVDTVRFALCQEKKELPSGIDGRKKERAARLGSKVVFA